jgi:hypothetical protein
MRKLGKNCVLLVFIFVSFKIVDHGSHQGNMARALAQWSASSGFVVALRM